MDPRTLYPKLTPFDVKFYLYQVLKADLAGQQCSRVFLQILSVAMNLSLIDAARTA